MKKIIGIILILGSFACGYFGIKRINENQTSLEVLDVKINVSKSNEKQRGYVFLGVGALLFVSGVYTLARK